MRPRLFDMRAPTGRARRGPGGTVRVLVVAAAGAAFGCGGEARAPSPPSPPAALSASERQLVREYESHMQAHCERVGRSLVDPTARPSAQDEARAFAAADALLALADRKPTAPVGPGQDLRLLVSDVVENFEGSNCDPRMVARLERGLRGIPVE